MKRLPAAILTFVVLLGATGCGTSREDLARDAVEGGGLGRQLGAQSSAEEDDALTTCLVEALAESDISDGGLRTLAHKKGPRIAGAALDALADDDEELSDADLRALVESGVTDCLTG